jgi:PAS domain-containing protein
MLVDVARDPGDGRLATSGRTSSPDGATMTAHVQNPMPSSSATGQVRDPLPKERVVERLRVLTNSHLRSLTTRRQPTITLDARPGTAGAVRLPRSHVVRSACGLTSFVGLLAVDGTLLEANQTTATPPELSACEVLGRPFWESRWWSWSPTVQLRMQDAVARVGVGEVMRFPETALVRKNQLITLDLAWAPLVRDGVVTALICSAIDLTSRRGAGSRPIGAETLPPHA